MLVWKKKTQKEIQESIFQALENNTNYTESNILGVPATHLDSHVFNQDATFLKDAPFITSLVKNPNHIGCHTLGKSESFFSGTQMIEQELIELCAVDILNAEPESIDGYVASGGTEANIQAIWIYRNYFRKEFNASLNEITILCSSDRHYSMDKASNLLDISIHHVAVEEDNRAINLATVKNAVEKAKSDGKKYFIVVCNMMTTMFGSVDDPEIYTSALKNEHFKMHVDGAYGGFYYPFSSKRTDLTFANPAIDSFTLDAHKMAQAPYGTGVFLVRKGLIHYANTDSASYVEGEDCTLIGSRSGANAVAVWMILMKHGPYSWFEKIFILQKRTDWMCEHLDRHDIFYYRNPFSNIITIRAGEIPDGLAKKYGLVPDNHHQAKWYKIVVMEHVTIEKMEMFLAELTSVLSER